MRAVGNTPAQPRVLVYDLFTFKGLSKGSLNIPAAKKYSFVQILGRSVQFNLFRPLADRLLFAFVGYKSVVVAVIGLLFSTRPLAITGLVALTIINSIKSVALGWLAHVFVKLLKGAPALTNLDASSAVILIVGFVWVVASLAHN